jgi:hypothetical protein
MARSSRPWFKGRVRGSLDLRIEAALPVRIRHRALLRERRDRQRGRRTTEKRDEFVPLHSITSSARASTVAGISMPSAFAVLRLMTSSYLDACSTGNSAGLTPLRILST